MPSGRLQPIGQPPVNNHPFFLTKLLSDTTIKLMKKKATAKIKMAPKSLVKKRSSVRYAKQTNPPVFTLQRVIVTTGFALLFVVFGLSYKNTDIRGVLGASIYRPLFVQSTVMWNPLKNASGYDVYYKQENEQSFSNSVMKVPADKTFVTIKNLKRGVVYEYQVFALIHGADVPVTSLLQMTNSSPM